MTPINLLDYTDTPYKIEAEILTPAMENKIKTWKILAAYGLDLYVVASATAMSFGIMKISVDPFLLTNTLRIASDKVSYTPFFGTLFATMIASYYFFSFFFNQGQTWGMKSMKNRIEMKSMNFSESLKWTFFSIAMITSGGLAIAWNQKRTFVSHDHLYQDLMTTKDEKIDLMGLLHNRVEKAHSNEEALSMAA